MADTGYIVGGKCYATQAAADAATFSAIGPTYSVGAVTYETKFAWDALASAWKQRATSIDTNGTSTLLWERSASVVTARCDPSADFLDGMALGWAIVGAVIAVAMIKAIQRAMQ